MTIRYAYYLGDKLTLRTTHFCGVGLAEEKTKLHAEGDIHARVVTPQLELSGGGGFLFRYCQIIHLLHTCLTHMVSATDRDVVTSRRRSLRGREKNQHGNM